MVAVGLCDLEQWRKGREEVVGEWERGTWAWRNGDGMILLEAGK
jgi:hypothetical protein